MTLKNEQDEAQKRGEQFNQAAALLHINGKRVNPLTLQFLQPLLDSSQNYEEHRASLEAMIRQLEA